MPSSPHLRGCFRKGRAVSRPTVEFPASAGVFLKREAFSKISIGVPRICGGVSAVEDVIAGLRVSSPHLRGCFYVGEYGRRYLTEFPASAGVFPRHPARRRIRLGVPRICGGVSGCPASSGDFALSSPHLRGCFPQVGGRGGSREEFPASAGVFRAITQIFRIINRVPRICGGVSLTKRGIIPTDESSPYLRGCFRLDDDDHLDVQEFPASAGVFPRRLLAAR